MTSGHSSDTLACEVMVLNPCPKLKGVMQLLRFTVTMYIAKSTPGSKHCFSLTPQPTIFM